jgi:hypothetical protein
MQVRESTLGIQLTCPPVNEPLKLPNDRVDIRQGERVIELEVTVLVELVDLRLRQFHGSFPPSRRLSAFITVSRGNGTTIVVPYGLCCTIS